MLQVEQCDEQHCLMWHEMQEKVQQRIEKMKAIQQSLTPADLARRDKELEPQVAALDAKRELDQIWMHVRTCSPMFTSLLCHSVVPVV